MKNHGYTLIEVLVVISLMAIFMGLALAGYQEIIAKNNTATHLNQLVAAINFARNEAILRHEVITLCKSKNGKNCSGEWKNGLIVFVDQQISGQVGVGDKILRVFSAVPNNSFLEWLGQRSNDYLQMDASGTTHGQAGTFYFYPDKNNKKNVNKVIVSQTGRVRIE